MLPSPFSPPLSSHDPASTLDLKDKPAAEAELAANVARIVALQYDLWAEGRRALLIVLQGMDTAGKDGVIRHVLSGVNPQGVRVHAFGRPTPAELAHDFLWRVHQVVPERGFIGVFNRSHYEDVLVARVERLAAPEEIERRYGLINDFERLISPETLGGEPVAGGGYVTVLKLFLHISRAEQRERLLARVEDPHKGWKMRAEDLAVRAKWDDYQHAYELALTRCSTPHAPWHVIPSDRKWARNTLVSRIIRHTLEAMNPRIPAPAADLGALARALA